MDNKQNNSYKEYNNQQSNKRRKGSGIDSCDCDCFECCDGDCCCHCDCDLCGCMECDCCPCL